MECYLTTLRQYTANVEIEFYQGRYLLRPNKAGIYWCKDSRKERSNILEVFYEPAKTVAYYMTMPVCPAQTTKEENGLVLQWPSLSVGNDALHTNFLSYTTVKYTGI